MLAPPLAAGITIAALPWLAVEVLLPMPGLPGPAAALGVWYAVVLPEAPRRALRERCRELGALPMALLRDLPVPASEGLVRLRVEVAVESAPTPVC